MIWNRPFTRAAADLIRPVAERPTRHSIITFVTLAGIREPAFKGIIDLTRRTRAP